MTTEKDGVRLMKFQQELQTMPLYVLPVKNKFLFGEGILFDESVKAFIKISKNNKAK